MRALKTEIESELKKLPAFESKKSVHLEVQAYPPKTGLARHKEGDQKSEH